MTEPTSPSGTIVVSGTGRVAVDPDTAELRLGVSISRPTVAAARAAAAEAMAAILAAVSGAGVDRRDVQTTTLSVQPRYDYRDGKPPSLTGYDLANVVIVTVRDLAGLGGVIDGALTAGATSLDGLAFRVEDPREPERAARTAAVAQARERAEVLAEAAGCPDRRRERHRRGRTAADLAAAEGGPGDARRRRGHAGRGRHDRDRGHGHGHVPAGLTTSAAPAAARISSPGRRSAATPRTTGSWRRPCRPRPRRSSSASGPSGRR